MRKITKMILLASLAIPSLAACSQVSKLSFKEREYTITSGESVTIEQSTSVKYTFVGSVDEDIKLDEDKGIITFNQNEYARRQVYYRAYNQSISSAPVIINLVNEVETPELKITNPTSYISNEDYVVATSSTDSAILYTLKEDVGGVHIDGTSGRITYTSQVTDETTFEVVATSHDVSVSKVFTAAITHLVSSKTEKQAFEKGSDQSISYELDFSDTLPDINNTVIAVYHKKTFIKPSTYTYDQDNHVLTFSPKGLKTLNDGENLLRVVTPRNAVLVTAILATKFIRTAEDLASINYNQTLLNGYLLLAKDIDLTTYLNDEEKGYDGGKYWKPIGLYHDTNDATQQVIDSFKGTFDGNGYKISGFKMNRKDEFGFNGGFFGFLGNSAIVKNLYLVGSTMEVASYCGGFVGVNYGKIENCIAEVESITATTGEEADKYKITGGFVGRNFGEIYSCISLTTSVIGDEELGSFAGSNDGVIQNCYSVDVKVDEKSLPFSNGAREPINCGTRANKAAIISDFNNLDVDKDVIQVVSSKLTIVPQIVFVTPYDILLNSSNSSYYRGQTISYTISIIPTSLQSQYLSQVTYSLIGDGATLNTSTKKITTTTNASDQLTLVASLDINGYVITSSISFNMYTAIESITFENVDEFVEPGKRYMIETSFTPTDAGEKVTFTCSNKFVSFEGNIMTISKDISLSKAVSITVIAKGKKIASAKSQSYPIHYPLEIEKASYLIYKNSEADISVTLPDGQDYNGAKLYKYSKSTDLFSIEGQQLIVKKENVTSVVDSDIPFTLRLANGEYITFEITYLSHEKIKKEDIQSPLIISTKNEFIEYFNIKDGEYSEDKYVNYSKNIIIDNDIDFENENLISIGCPEDGKNFTGKMYGFGHTIKNFTITDNEKWHTSSDHTGKYRSSLYDVGFFSQLGGSVYDLTFENAEIHPNNFVGGLAGVSKAGSVVENVHFINSKVLNINGQDYSSGDVVTGRLIGRNGSIVTGCSFNGSLCGLIGG